MRFLFKRPVVIVAVCAAVTVFFAIQLRKIRMDNSIRQYFPQAHSSFKALIDSEDTFGSTVAVGISLETDKGLIVTPANIAIIDRITEGIAALPTVDKIDSLTSVDYIYGEDGGLVAGQLIDMDRDEDGFLPPLTDEQAADVRRRLAEWDDMYSRVIVSEDGRAAQLAVTLKVNNHPNLVSAAGIEAPEVDALAAAGVVTIKDFKRAVKSGAIKNIEGISENTVERVAAYARMMPLDSDVWQRTLGEMRSVVERWTEGSGLKAIYFGDAVFSESARSYILTDLIALVPLVVLVVLVSLFISFKTVDGTLLPLISVLMASLWTCGLMAAFGFTFTIISSIIPVALIACGSAYGIHVLTHYYVFLNDALARGEAITRESHKEIILKGLSDVHVAVFLAALTTVVGFASLIGSPLAPLHGFAIFTALGIAFSYILSVTFIPALLMLKPPSKIGRKSRRMEKLAKKVKRKMEMRENDPSDSSGLYKIYKSLCGSKFRLASFMAVILLVAFYGVRRLHVDTNMLNYFPKDSKFHRDVDYADGNFAGTKAIYMIVRGPAQKDADGNDVVDENGKVLRVEGCMNDPEILEAIDSLQDNLAAKFKSVGKAVSFTTFIKRMNQVMHVPAQSAAFDAQGADGVSDFSNDDFSEDFGDDFGGDFSDSFGDFSDDFGGDFGGGFASETAGAASSFIDPNDAYSRALSQKMTVSDGIAMFAEAYAEAGGRGASIEDMVKAIERRLNYNGTAYYEIPRDVSKYPVASEDELRDLVGQYLLLYSGSLDDFANNPLQPTELRVQIQLREYSADSTRDLTREVNSYVKSHFPEGYTVELTGSAELEYLMADMVVSSQALSLIGSLLCVFIIIGISFRSPLAGLVGALPLALTIALNYMVMGFCKIDLDLITSIIASVAVGVGIDYTIHFMETYRAKRAEAQSISEATKLTFKTSGVGIVTNALAVGLGFLALYLSRFVVLRYVGVLVAIVMFTSSTLAMTVIPGILTNFDPRFIRPAKEGADGDSGEEAGKN